MSENGEIYHYGTKYRSGRYPYGSGEDPYQHDPSWVVRLQELRDAGMTDSEIAKSLGMTSTKFRAKKALETNAYLASCQHYALELKKKGWSTSAIARQMDTNESTVRGWLDPAKKERRTVAMKTADSLAETMGERGAIDIGLGIEHHLGISPDKLREATAIMKERGYEVHTLHIKQHGNVDQYTTMKVLATKGLTDRELYENPDLIIPIAKPIDDVSGHSGYLGIDPPVAVKSSRVGIRYAEDGGTEADGVMLIRPGAEDLALGQSRYAQVRISVDGTHYLKGMAMYGDPSEFPKGVDIIFNTNKHKGTPKLGEKDNSVLKPMKDDPDNPFGATVRQFKYKDGKTGKMEQSAINIVNEEGTWSTWSKQLASQMLSKQSPKLAQRQLDIAFDRMQSEYDEIMALTNPVVKKKLLEEFANQCDSDAVHLRAAAMPRQATKVILPIKSLKDTEIYAPHLQDGERVVLIRYPHGGTFEIPELVVNNKNQEGRKLLGQPKDAVGINAKVAERLSGADFDGDTVLVIPNNRHEVRSTPPLAGLKDFDPKAAYPKYPGMKVMSESVKQKEMGKISNLITDMTIKGAPLDEIERAVRHSMVVIDAAKHELNYKQSEIDNGIAALKKRWQQDPETGRGGVSTLISRTTSPVYLPHRKLRPAKQGGHIDPETGELVYIETHKTRSKPIKKNGEVVGWTTVPKVTKSTKGAEAKDARELSSGTLMETIYANHANRLKALANRARKSYLSAPTQKVDPVAKQKYAAEVASLTAKLNQAEKRAPLERRARVLAGQIYESKKADMGYVDKDDLKRLNRQALGEARERVGLGRKDPLVITDSEWEAIQNRAVSASKLERILKYANSDKVRQLATPREQPTMTSTKIARAKGLMRSGYTYDQIAKVLGVSTSTLMRAIE